jgi:hypothetical protein
MSNVDHPDHYNQGEVECIDVIEQLDLSFCLGNALKYIWRCKDKGKKIEDLNKAIWYIDREITNTRKAIYVEKERNNEKSKLES